MIRTLIIITGLVLITSCESDDQGSSEPKREQHSHEHEIHHESEDQIEREGHEAVENAERKLKEYEDSVARVP